MRENAETGKPACEQAGDPVREDYIDLRQPSLTKPHHEHARRGDGDNEDDDGVHGSLLPPRGIGYGLIEGKSGRTSACVSI
jgi:hypothetical protein